MPCSVQLYLTIVNEYMYIDIFRIEIAITQSSDIMTQELELKEYVKQLSNHKNFLWFAAMNFVQVSKKQHYRRVHVTM